MCIETSNLVSKWFLIILLLQDNMDVDAGTAPSLEQTSPGALFLFCAVFLCSESVVLV